MRRLSTLVGLLQAGRTKRILRASRYEAHPTAEVDPIMDGLTVAMSHVPIGNFEAIASDGHASGGPLFFDVPFIDIAAPGRVAWPIRWILPGLDQGARGSTLSLVIPCRRIS